MSYKNQNNSKGKKGRLRSKQILVVGLVALVLAAGYYRWTLGTVDPDAVNVSSSAAPNDENNNADEDKEAKKEMNNSENAENTADTSAAKETENKKDTENKKETEDAEETEETFWSKNDREDEDEQEKQEGNENNESQNDTGSSAVVQARLDRDKLRGETMDKWKEISANKDATDSTKKEAENNILKLTEYSEKENAIETGVKSKGFEDCFAQVSDSGVSVIVKGGSLDNSTVAQIKDIIIAETGVSASQIKISSEQ